jgi:nitronate monooxygenase
MSARMWGTAFRHALGLEHAIVQAPMGGGITTPELVAAVGEAGALGSIGAAMLPPDALRAAVREVRARTRRPFAVNPFAPAPMMPPAAGVVQRAAAALEPIRRELGLSSPPDALAAATLLPFDANLDVVVEERVPVFSFTFGTLPAEAMRRLHAAGAFVLGSATTVAEAQALEAAGCDAVVAQGSEAGGNRATFAGPFEAGAIGTVALVPQVVDAIRVPVLAAGGIMDGRGIAAALALGAAGVQMGTAFIACRESGAPPAYKAAVLQRRDADPTALTRAFSGRLSRALRNRLMDEIEAAGAIAPYPLQEALVRDVRAAAGRQGRSDLVPFYAGQGAPLSRNTGAGELVAALVAEARAALDAVTRR